MDAKSLTTIRLAVYVGGLIARGEVNSNEAVEEIREKMEAEDLDPTVSDEVLQLAYTFAAFSGDVRAAERKGRPIVRHFGEKFPE